MISSVQYSVLLSFPETEFGLSASSRWVELCEQLSTYSRQHEARHFPSVRKWELVSALQKAIRRGDRSVAMQLIAMIEGTTGESSYFWRRLPVIACEDIGIGDSDLTVFTVACSQTFTPVKSKAVLFDVFAFLVGKLCSTPNLSRTACDLACIESNLRADSKQPLANLADEILIAAIESRNRELTLPDTSWRRWQRKNDWRGSQLLRFHEMNLPFPLLSRHTSLPPFRMIQGLPNYCYDMYTRVGRTVLHSLLSGVAGAERIRNLLSEPGVCEPLLAAGEALFFEEGGLLQDEVGYECVADLNQRLFANQFGLGMERWQELRAHMRAAIQLGIVDTLREKEVSRQYAQLPLFQL